MKTRCSVLLLLVLTLAGVVESTEDKQRSTEQLNFSAEDTSVKKPVAIPKEVLAILRNDRTVQSVLDNENIPPENLPSSWFSASAIHLSAASGMDLVVVGEPPVVGGNVTIFWVFCSTPEGYKLVLTAPAHGLEVKKTRWNGHRNIELTSMSAVKISTVLCRFDGQQYIEFRSSLEPIQ